MVLKNQQLINYSQIVSHDLQSLIANIILIIDIIDRITDEKDRQKLFPGFKNGVARIIDTLNVVVDIAKIDAEGLSTERMFFEEAYSA